jgi:hypothetical protein
VGAKPAAEYGFLGIERSERFSRWLERRIPRAHHITLNQDSIFIFPTVTGFVFGGLVVLLIVGAINYQNSLVYGVAFLLGSLFLVTILYTFRNLSGLTIEFVGAGSGFVGESVEFEVRVSRPEGRGREGVQLGWPGTIPQWAELYDSAACSVRLFVPAPQRGCAQGGCWSRPTPAGVAARVDWVDLHARALVYRSRSSTWRRKKLRGRGTRRSSIRAAATTNAREYRSGDGPADSVARLCTSGDSS